MNDIKLSVKLGPLEIQYDGSTDFAESQLADIIHQISTIELPDIGVEPQNSQSTNGEAQSPNQLTDGAAKLSTTDFAVKTGAKSGSDLVMAAAAYLHHTRGVETFRRSDLLSEMKAAKAFYRSSHGGNLSKSLDTLVKSGKLQNPSSETYALPYSEIENTKNLL